MANILLIDDDQVLLKLYSTRLSSDNHQVRTATDGEVGLSLIDQAPPDIIVLDLLMPKVNGFNVLQTLRANPKHASIPVIVFSSVANQEQLQRLQQLGVSVILNKIETSPTKLVEIIQQTLTSTFQKPVQ